MHTFEPGDRVVHRYDVECSNVGVVEDGDRVMSLLDGSIFVRVRWAGNDHSALAHPATIQHYIEMFHTPFALESF